MKTCVRCKVSKENSDFHRNKNSSDGLVSYCKTCKSEYGKRNIYERSTEHKICSLCKMKKSPDEFHSHRTSTDGLQGCCKLCQHEKAKKYYERGGVETFLKKLFRQIKKNADNRKIKVDINLEYLKELYNSQGGKCAISGIEMTYESYASNNNRCKNIHNISPDRIDTNVGYVKGNIHLVCNIINIMKWDFGLNDFLHMCKVVSNFNSF